MTADVLTQAVEALPTIVAGGFSIGGGFVFALKFLEFLGGRVDKREAAVSAAMSQVDEGTKTLIQHLQSQLSWFAEELGEVRQLLVECQERDHKSQARIAQLEGLMQGLGDAKQHGQLIASAAIAELKEKG